VAKLSDVGLTKRLEATLTRPGGWTPAYAAPEILARSGANEKSDIFSFGLMVWQVQERGLGSCL
jgi:serine/threonine protein kinase